MIDWLGKPLWIWLSFLLIVLLMMALDLGLLNKKAKVVSIKESMVSCAVYVALALAFGLVIWWLYYQEVPTSNMDERLLTPDSTERAWLALQLYLTGYMIELSLSMDNVFVFSMIFSYFAIPQQYQQRVLFWGIIGVVVMRAVMILAGAALVHEFAWILVVFGVFLIFTGVKMLVASESAHDIGNNPLLKYVRKHFPITHDLHGEKFFIKQQDPKTGKLITYMTPLFLVLLLIDVADVVFAVDSVPAIFAITKDPYIVYTSNIFAILGLRSLYFTLSAMVHRFAYLKYALAAVLVFIGLKICAAELLHIKLAPLFSLGVTVAMLVGGVGYSLWKTRTAHEPHPKV